MQKELFDLLVDKYLNGNANATEKKVLFEYMDRMSQTGSVDMYTESEVEEITRTLYDRLTAENHRKQVKIIHLERKWFFRISVAAAFLLVFIGGYWLMKHHQNTGSEIVQKDKDILPGTNKATLLLADGKRVLLDEAATGKITAFASKTGDGKLVYQSNTVAVSYNTLTTPRGGQHYVKLADGTGVWLNAASSITFPTAFTGRSRAVTITGEVYFEVAKDKTRPFHVQYNDIDITVLGTHFNVMAYTDEESVKTTLLEGSVKVKRGTEQVLLRPGQQAEVTHKELKKVVSADIEEVMSWRNGMFLLNGTDIGTVMRQVSRWYDVEVVYKNGVPEGHLVGDIPRTMPLSKILEGLKISGLPCEMEGKKIIVSN